MTTYTITLDTIEVLPIRESMSRALREMLDEIVQLNAFLDAGSEASPEAKKPGDADNLLDTSNASVDTTDDDTQDDDDTDNIYDVFIAPETDCVHEVLKALEQYSPLDPAYNEAFADGRLMLHDGIVRNLFGIMVPNLMFASLDQMLRRIRLYAMVVFSEQIPADIDMYSTLFTETGASRLN